MEIRQGDLTNPLVLALLNEHLASMALHSPAESCHVFPPERLGEPEVTFWCLWDGEELLGCGALKELDPAHGEIKSMRTSAKHLRRGVGSMLLRHLIDEANRRSYERLSLETGSAEVFIPALALYAAFGFERCGPFGAYVEDPFAVFMTLEL